MSAQPDRGQDAARRAARIVETVERAASGILDEAEEEARRHVESSHLRAEREAAERLRGATELADGLVERAERLRGELDRLIEALGSTRVRLEEVLEEGEAEAAPSSPVVEMPSPPEPSEPDLGPGPFEPQEPFGAGLRPVPEPQPEPDPEPQEDQSLSSSGARVLATQMAMAGNSRGEVAECLEEEMSREEASRILDAVFGTED